MTQQSFITINYVYYLFYITVRFVFLTCVYTGRKFGFFLPPETTITDIDAYENKIKSKFLTFQDCETIDEYKLKNDNISTIFYDRKKLIELLKNQNNDIEKEWKRRVLINYTPRGNVIMFYDAYKGGFSYYSDNSMIPTRILNCVAMKYVMLFSCLDFFVDETTMISNTSPLIKLLNDEDDEEVEKKKKIFDRLSEKTNIVTDKLPFVRKNTFKSPFILNANGDANANGGNGISSTSTHPQKRNNKYIYLGKTNNFSVIQKKVKKHIFTDNNAELSDEQFGFKNVNYDEYKKSKKNV